MNFRFVGWVERSDTHHQITSAMGIALLNPSYDSAYGPKMEASK